MKVAIFSPIFILLVTANANAFPVDDNHYVQHQSTVDAAKERLNQRLNQMQHTVGSQRSSGYSSNCLSCVGGYSQNLRSSSVGSSQSSSSNVVEGSDYVGVGYVGHANSRNHDVEDVQTRLSPSTSSSNRYASSNVYEEKEEEDEDTQQRVVPSNLSGIGASAYRASSQHTSYDEEDRQKTVGVGFHDATVNSDNDYISRRKHQQQQQQQQYSESETTRSTPQVYYVPAPEPLTTGQQRQTIASGSNQVYRISARPGTTTVLQIPVRASSDQAQQQYISSSRTSGYQASESSLNQPTRERVVTYYVPSTDRRESASSRREYESSRTEKYVAPDLTAYNSFNTQSRSQAEDLQESDLQTRVKPVYTPTIIDGGSSRYASSGSSQINSQRSQTRVVPAFPVSTIESSSSSLHRTAEEQQQRQQASLRPSYVHRTSNADEGSSTRRTAEQSSSYGSSGATIYRAPITTQSRLQSQSQLQNSQFNSRAGYGGNSYSPYVPTYSSSRLGSGILNSNSDNLHEYISESQRLAEAQQRQLTASQGSSSSYSSVSEANRRALEQAQRLDSTAVNFVGSSNSNLLNRNSEIDTESVTGAGNTGYQHVQSWQKQSKWESGSQYGSDGTPKTYSMLSTAEAEKHNINGAEAGFKAATTTLENDGKVSTYSIHTP